MSYILEALKKSEQERQLGAVPRPEAAVATTRAAVRSRWPWLLSAVLLLNAGILLWLVLRPAGSPLANATSAAPVAASPAGPGQDTAETSTPADPPEQAVAQRPQSPVEVAPQPQSQPEPRPGPAPEPVPESAPAAVATVPAPARGSVQWMQQPEGPESPAPVAPRAPRWDELGASEKSGLNRPHLDVHVYAEAPAQRFVLIDLKRYREGERLDSGGRLAAITPEGVIIEARGIRYRVDRP